MQKVTCKPKVTVTLGRKLLGVLLNVFVPTTILNLIGFSTNFYKVINFEPYQLCRKLYDLPKNVSGCIFWVGDSYQPHVHAGLGCTLCSGQNWRKKIIFHGGKYSFAQMHFNILTATCNDVVNSDLPVMAYIKMMGLWLIFIQTSTIHLNIYENDKHLGELWPTSDSLHQDGRRLADLQPHHPLRPHRHPHIHGHPSPVSWAVFARNWLFSLSSDLSELSLGDLLTFLNLLGEIYLTFLNFLASLGEIFLAFLDFLGESFWLLGEIHLTFLNLLGETTRRKKKRRFSLRHRAWEGEHAWVREDD